MTIETCRQNSIQDRRGFSLVEVLIATFLLWIFVGICMTYANQMSKNSQQVQTVTARDRILSGIRVVAGLPASLRNSGRAALSTGAPFNIDLNNCIDGTNANGCTNDKESPFALFSPIMNLDSTGQPILVQEITSPYGSKTSSIRFDTFGAPCPPQATNCPLSISTSFVPQCGPQTLAVNPANFFSPTDALAPTSTCTVAEAIRVNYWVVLDSSAAADNPSLAAFLTPVTGSVITSVKLISGNDPQ